MKQFFKTNHHGDERITHEKNKIYKECYMLCQVICLASIILKSLFNESGNFMLILPEFLILIVPNLYSFIKSVFLGLYSEEVELTDKVNKLSTDTKLTLSSLLPGIILGLLIGIRNSLLYAEDTQTRIYYFILIFFTVILFYVPITFAISFTTHTLGKEISKKKSIPEEDDNEEY